LFSFLRPIVEGVVESEKCINAFSTTYTAPTIPSEYLRSQFSILLFLFFRTLSSTVLTKGSPRYGGTFISSNTESLFSSLFSGSLFLGLYPLSTFQAMNPT
jgi:hypothetical protein